MHFFSSTIQQLNLSINYLTVYLIIGKTMCCSSILQLKYISISLQISLPVSSHPCISSSPSSPPQLQRNKARHTSLSLIPNAKERFSCHKDTHIGEKKKKKKKRAAMGFREPMILALRWLNSGGIEEEMRGPCRPGAFPERTDRK